MSRAGEPGYEEKMAGNSSGSIDIGDFRLLENVVIPVDWAAALILFKLLKTPEGQRLAERFGEKWLATQADMVTALAQSGAGNIVTAFSHGHLIAMMLEHNYMIRKGGAKSWHDSMAWLTGAVTIAEIFGDVAVPATLVFSAGTGALTSPSGAGALAKILGALK